MVKSPGRLPCPADTRALGSERGSRPDPAPQAFVPIPVPAVGTAEGAGAQPPARGPLAPSPWTSPPCRGETRSAPTHPARIGGGGIRRGSLRTRPPAWHMEAGREGEQAASAMEQAGQRPQPGMGGDKGGTDGDYPLQGPGLQGPGLLGQHMGWGKSRLPPACLPRPPQQLGGGCTPHSKLSPLLPAWGYPQPPKSIRLSPGRGSPGGQEHSPRPPPPAGKQHLGFQRDSCVLNPIFQMDGGRRAGQVTCLKVTQGQRRSRISCKGWLDAPFAARWWLQTPSLGTRGVLGDRQHHPQAGRQLPWHPQGSVRAQGAAPRQPPTHHSGSPLPGMTQVGPCPAGWQLSEHTCGRRSVLRGVRRWSTQENDLLVVTPVSPLPPRGPQRPLPLNATGPEYSIPTCGAAAASGAIISQQRPAATCVLRAPRG